MDNTENEEIKQRHVLLEKEWQEAVDIRIKYLDRKTTKTNPKEQHKKSLELVQGVMISQGLTESEAVDFFNSVLGFTQILNKKYGDDITEFNYLAEEYENRILNIIKSKRK